MSNTNRDETLHTADPLEVRMGFLQKYGIRGVLVLGLSLMAPYAGSMLDNYNNKSVARAVKSSVKPLEQKLTHLETLWVGYAGGAKLLDAADINYIARMAVKSQSIYKVQEITQLLEKYSGKRTKAINARLKKHIRNILITNSSVYVTGLNKYQHRSTGKIGDYIAKTFPMESFLDNVYSIVLDPSKPYTTKEDRAVIAEDVMLYMLSIQDSFFTTMYYKMHAKEHL